MMLRFLLALIMLTGCGGPAIHDFIKEVKFVLPSDEYNTRTVDWELEPFVQSFEEAYKNKIDFKVSKGTTERPVIGYCRNYGENKGRLVVIDEQFMNEGSYAQIEVLVWHELGHCALGKGHDDTVKYLNGYGYVPFTVMQSFVFSAYQAKIFEEQKQYYIDNLFNK